MSFACDAPSPKKGYYVARIRPATVERLCICCQRKRFRSEGPHHRMCGRCRRGTDLAVDSTDRVSVCDLERA